VTNDEYQEKIRGLGWAELRELFAQIEARDTPGWEPGKAFEYLVPRLFELDGAIVRWPYEVHLHGHVVEQIDGAIKVAGLYCLLECKDQKEPLAIAPVAKMRNQLQRRPSASVGMIFSMSAYTQPARVLVGYLGIQTILLWFPGELRLAIDRQRIVPLLEFKYGVCVEEGIHAADTAERGVL
jgi:Restriction endonuclease